MYLTAIKQRCDTERTVLLKDLKFQLDTNKKNNFVELSTTNK